jgi:hypothetical protein
MEIFWHCKRGKFFDVKAEKLRKYFEKFYKKGIWFFQGKFVFFTSNDLNNFSKEFSRFYGKFGI